MCHRQCPQARAEITESRVESSRVGESTNTSTPRIFFYTVLHRNFILYFALVALFQFFKKKYFTSIRIIFLSRPHPIDLSVHRKRTKDIHTLIKLLPYWVGLDELMC